MEQPYRNELDGIGLTEESKQALIDSLNGRRTEEAPRPRRMLRTSVAIAAAVCLLVVVAVAAVVSAPVLRAFYGGAGYEQSGAALGHAVTQNGWTMTLTDCMGDDRYLYLGLELTAPEGAVLDKDTYQLEQDDFAFPGLGQPGFAWRMMLLPDGNPADNRLSFVLWIERYHHDMQAGFNGQEMTLTVGGLFHLGAWDTGKENYDYDPIYDCRETWDFGTLTVAYPDNAVRLTPDIPVTVLDVEAVLTHVEVTPIGLCVTFEGDGLKGHHDKYNNGYCYAVPEMNLYTKDGTLLEPDKEAAPFGVRGGSGCSGGGELEKTEPGMLHLVRSYGYLLDMDAVDYVEICGVRIAL